MLSSRGSPPGLDLRAPQHDFLEASFSHGTNAVLLDKTRGSYCSCSPLHPTQLATRTVLALRGNSVDVTVFIWLNTIRQLPSAYVMVCMGRRRRTNRVERAMLVMYATQIDSWCQLWWHMCALDGMLCVTPLAALLGRVTLSRPPNTHQ